MLLLFTGAPGASKTSHVIDKYIDEKSRPIFYYNIALNDEGRSKLGWIEYTQEQVLNWQNELPTNAILIVDECQRVWPVRSSSKPVPESCTAMETHRHQGVDIVLITQHPGLIDSHIRKLVNEHYHFSRPFGMPFAVQYHSGSGVVSPDSRSELAQCTQSKKPLPKRVWPLYKSAEVHTHKAKVPNVVYFIVFAALLAVYLIWKFLNSYGPSEADSLNNDSSVVQSVPSMPAPVSSRSEDVSWAYLLTPEIAGVPFTAPLYREEAMRVSDVPRIAGCVLIGDRCRCYTQQGTPIADIPKAVCEQYLSSPPFNHMRQPEPVNYQAASSSPVSIRAAQAPAAAEARSRAVLLRSAHNVSVTR